MIALRNVEREEVEPPRGIEVEIGEEHLLMPSTLCRVLIDVFRAAEWAHAAGGIARVVGARKRRIGIQQQILMAAVGLQEVHRDVADVTDGALGGEAADERVRGRKMRIDAIECRLSCRERRWRWYCGIEGRTLYEVRNLIDAVLAH